MPMAVGKALECCVCARDTDMAMQAKLTCESVMQFHLQVRQASGHLAQRRTPVRRPLPLGWPKLEAVCQLCSGYGPSSISLAQPTCHPAPTYTPT